ncbi:MAG: hypothetical protein ACXQS8_04275 [Candidatus Helarchaeales archaeon]
MSIKPVITITGHYLPLLVRVLSSTPYTVWLKPGFNCIRDVVMGVLGDDHDIYELIDGSIELSLPLDINWESSTNKITATFAPELTLTPVDLNLIDTFILSLDFSAGLDLDAKVRFETGQPLQYSGGLSGFFTLDGSGCALNLFDKLGMKTGTTSVTIAEISGNVSLSRAFSYPCVSDVGVDSDQDYLSDSYEMQIGTDPGMQDTDSDGLWDNVELTLGTDPLDPDTDDDGFTDGEEVFYWQTNPLLSDSDGDGLIDTVECWTFLTDPALPDADFDGLNDSTEVNSVYDLDPNIADTDGDGFLDGLEVNWYATDPTSNSSVPRDSDGDTFLDAWETDVFGTDPEDLADYPQVVEDTGWVNIAIITIIIVVAVASSTVVILGIRKWKK